MLDEPLSKRGAEKRMGWSPISPTILVYTPRKDEMLVFLVFVFSLVWIIWFSTTLTKISSDLNKIKSYTAYLVKATEYTINNK